jgi:transcriptional regulator with XRE-family HTH domain
MYGARIRELRKRRGWTMKQLGQRLDVAESTISGYENEIRRPDMDALLRFAELFDVTVDYLLGRESVPSGDSASPFPPPEALRESATPYYAAIWDGQVESLTEEEATHLRNTLEMFRLWKANRRPSDGE